MRNWCVERGMEQRFMSVAHRQSNGQIEVSNRTSVHGIKKQLGKAKGNWVDELPEVLWSYRTPPQTSTRERMFSLAYGAEEMLPVEIMMSLIRIEYYQEQANDENLRENIDLLEERRECSSVPSCLQKNSREILQPAS